MARGAALAQPWCDVVLSGAVTTAQLTANLVPVPDLDLPDLAEPPGTYWATRAELPWT